jgi:hypothetical protein
LGNLPSAILWTQPYHVSWFCSLSFIIVSSSPICCLIVTFLILSSLCIHLCYSVFYMHRYKQPGGRRVCSIHTFLLITLKLMHVRHTAPYQYTRTIIQPSYWRWILCFETCRRHKIRIAMLI